MVRLAYPICLVAALAASKSALAEPLVFPIEEVLALGNLAYSSADTFEDSLAAILPNLRREPSEALATQDDPFRWAMGGTFGGEGASAVPGAIFGCARYGIHTRDLFAEHGFARPETFGLMGEVLPLSDDDEVWPEAAVARLHCTFIWDDAETVAIMPEHLALAALFQVFEAVDQGEDSNLFLPLLGEGGFRFFATNGPNDSVVWLESGDVILTNGHQQVSFRAFLIGGAV